MKGPMKRGSAVLERDAGATKDMFLRRRSKARIERRKYDWEAMW
jgi:hypothetical protein